MSVYLADPDVTLHHGDAIEVLAGLPDGSVDCVVTSPPYWGLRDYGIGGQLGLEPTPEEYVAAMVDVFREVRRVLADHGTCWLNLGDSYNSGANFNHDRPGSIGQPRYAEPSRGARPHLASLKHKDLVGVPWRVAFALQADGWYLRSDIVWSKPNPMPESVTDRPTKAHEFVFLLTKQPRYFFDQEAVREPNQLAATGWVKTRSADGTLHGDAERAQNGRGSGTARVGTIDSGRNVRSVWEIATQPYPEAHFATYPEELVRRCLLAGCPAEVCRVCGKPRERLVEVGYEKCATGGGKQKPTGRGDARRDPASRTDLPTARLTKTVETLGWSDCGHGDYRPGVVLDPFAGSGTTMLVARKHGRRSVGIELNESYCALAARRLQQLSLLAEPA